MNTELINVTESVQKMAALMLATNPAGEGLCLIGGFRYRLLDGSCRRSMDLDYHWNGDLEAKRTQIAKLFRKKLLPLISERLGYEASANPASGSDAESPVVKTLEVAVWQKGGPMGRVTIPVDITWIPCADKPVVRTVDGVMYLSVSDSDMVESKVISIFMRRYLQERDIFDLFLFQSQLTADAPKGVRAKLRQLSMPLERVTAMLEKIVADREYHIRNIEGIMENQIDAQAVANLRIAGGAAIVFDRVMEILATRLGLTEHE